MDTYFVKDEERNRYDDLTGNIWWSNYGGNYQNNDI
jgi:hypothetical protein